MAAAPGEFPVYSSARENNGLFGSYGLFMFDEELITWSVDGGGKLFYRPRHKFSVTNVGGILRLRKHDRLTYPYLHRVLSHLHGQVRFDWVRKAHPSVILKLYTDIPVPPIEVQRQLVRSLDEIEAEIDRLIAIYEQKLAALDALKQSLLHQAFTGAL
jgi:type I restriction enzyme S subunit